MAGHPVTLILSTETGWWPTNGENRPDIAGKLRNLGVSAEQAKKCAREASARGAHVHSHATTDGSIPRWDSGRIWRDLARCVRVRGTQASVQEPRAHARGRAARACRRRENTSLLSLLCCALWSSSKKNQTAPRARAHAHAGTRSLNTRSVGSLATASVKSAQKSSGHLRSRARARAQAARGDRQRARRETAARGLKVDDRRLAREVRDLRCRDRAARTIP